MLRNHKQRFKADPITRRLSWYAAVFGEVAEIMEPGPGGKLVQYRERIMPGAFVGTLSDPRREVVANLDHDDGRIFARRSDGSLLLQEDPHGLYCSAWIPDGEFGDAILADVDAGRLDGCSFRFDPIESRTAADGTVERVAVHLADVCLTASPAYEATHVLKRTAADGRLKFLRSKLRLLKLRAAK